MAGPNAVARALHMLRTPLRQPRPSRQWRWSAVDVAAVVDVDHGHRHHAVVQRVDDAVVPHPQPILATASAQLLHVQAGRVGVAGDGSGMAR
jgi:hypothetical protein